jgi:AbrB family transcriptional regulator, transcriptional pleiotropic regulator of transition state genes
MKSTGVVRKIDELGRIVLPSEIRKVFAIHEGDELDISVEGDQIILQKRRDLCTFCGSEDPQIVFKDRRVCNSCAGELGERIPREVRIPDATTVP